MSDTLEHLAAALVGRYAIGRELGRGGMATVFAARHEDSGEEVAVKVLHRDLTVALGPARFKREIEIASSLDHPHILPVLDSGVAGGSLYLVMPLVTGETLHDRLVRERQLSIAEAVRLTIEVAGALAYAHEHGVVHRDIKPENILLQDGRALVADFGIARATTAGEKLTQTGLSLGTPTYMSPEQAAAERDLDGRSDQYSLGCMLYEMLAGGPPYTAPTAQGLMARHALDAIPSISIMRDTVPDQIEDALYRALAKSPADRFPRISDFATALGDPARWTTGKRARGDRRSAPRGTADRRRSRVRRALYSAALTVPMAVAGWAGWEHWLRPPAAGALTADAAIAARRVAVLYFEDLTPDRRLAPIADGLTESLIDQLDRVEQLDVISANGVLPFRGREIAPDSVERALKVGTLVRGSVEGAPGGGVQLTVSLIDARSGDRIGSANFRQPAGGVLALRDTLAERVAEFLRARIGEEFNLRRTRAGTANVEAWTLARRADRLRREADSLFRRSDSAGFDAGLRQADSLWAAASALDPRWPEPLARRAEVGLRRAHGATDLAELRAYNDSATARAERALQLDARGAAALELRGRLRYQRRERGLAPEAAESQLLLAGAERDLRAAVAIEPSRAEAWNALSVLHYGRLNVVEANLAARRAYEADAYLTAAPNVLWRLFATAYDMEQFVDASHWCAEGGRRFPAQDRFVTCALALLGTKAKQPDVDAAWRLVAELEKAAPAAHRELEARRARIYAAVVIGRAGHADSARRVLERARAGPDVDPRGGLMGYEAFARLQLGDREEAIALLQRYLTAHPEHRAGFTKANAWWWRDIQNDQRFRDLVGAAP